MESSCGRDGADQITLNDYREYEQPVRDFGAIAAYPINERVTNHVVMIKGRSISDDDLAAVANWVMSLGSVKQFFIMGWVPRYNMNHYGVVSEPHISTGERVLTLRLWGSWMADTALFRGQCRHSSAQNTTTSIGRWTCHSSPVDRTA